jgi:hypothetical protein
MSEKCRLESEQYVLRTVQCCHIALRTAVTVQHSDHSSDKHTAEHLQHTDTTSQLGPAPRNWDTQGGQQKSDI